MTYPDQTSDWPTKAVPPEPSPAAPSIVSVELARALKVQRKNPVPMLIGFGLGVVVAIGGYSIFAAQQGSFSLAGESIDAQLSDARSTGVSAGQRAAVVTGEAARTAGANIDNALERAAADPSQSDPPKTPAP
jgi:hypothetical protein